MGQSGIEPDDSEQNVVEHEDIEKNGIEQDVPGAADMGNLREAV